MPNQFSLQKPTPPLQGLKAAAPGQEPIPQKWAIEPEWLPDPWPIKATKAIGGFFGIDDQTTDDPRSASGWNQAGQIGAAALPFAAGLPGMYSRLQQAVSKLPGSMKASSALNALRKFAHPEEIEFTGVGKMLGGMGNQPVRQMDIANQAVNNEIRLGVTELPKPAAHPKTETEYLTSLENGTYSPTPTTFDRYQMPGSIPGSYRETLIKVPVTKNQEALSGMRRAGYAPDDIEDVQAAFGTKEAPTFESQHFPDHPNTLAFVRHNERMLPRPLPEGFKVQTGTDFESAADSPVSWVEGRQPDPTNTIRGWNHYMGPSGKTPEEAISKAMAKDLGSKGRVLENVQSDWHQEGARSGYGPPVPVDPEIKERLTFVLAERDHIEQQAYAAGVDPSQISQQYDALAQEYEQLHRQLDAHQGAASVPDAPFKDGRWADLALKQQVLDVANHPDLEWLGIAPGSESVKRGESMSPVFHDENLPNRLGKILAPFGGKMEQAGLGFKKDLDIRSDSAIGDYGGVSLYDAGMGRHELASALPGTDPHDLAKTIQAQQSEVQIWLSRMSPEMKAAILKKGLPLLSLYAMMKGQQAPLRGLKQAAPPQADQSTVAILD